MGFQESALQAILRFQAHIADFGRYIVFDA